MSLTVTPVARTGSVTNHSSGDQSQTMSAIRQRSLQKHQDPTSKIGTRETSHSPNGGRNVQGIANALIGAITPNSQLRKTEVSPKITGDRNHYRSPSRSINEIPLSPPQYTQEQQGILHQASELYNKAERLKNEGKTKDSIDLLIQRVKLLTEKFSDSFTLATAYRDLGSAREKNGDLDKALTCYERAMPLFEKNVPNSPELAKFYEDFALLCEGLSNVVKALEYYEKSCALLKSLNVNKDDLATLNDKMALLLEAQGEPSRAIELRLNNIPIYAEVHSGSLTLANYYELLASYYDKNEATETMYLRKCVEIERSCSPDEVAIKSQEIRKLYGDKEKLEETFTHLTNSSAPVENTVPTLPSQASSYTSLGGVRKALVKHMEVVAKFERLLKKKIALDPKNLVSAAYCELLGGIYSKPGHEKESKLFYSLSLSILERVRGQNHKDVIALSQKIVDLPGRLASMSQARLGSYIQEASVAPQAKRAQSIAPLANDLDSLVRKLEGYSSGKLSFTKNESKEKAKNLLLELIKQYKNATPAEKENKHQAVLKYVENETDNVDNPVFEGGYSQVLFALFRETQRLFSKKA